MGPRPRRRSLRTAAAILGAGLPLAWGYPAPGPDAPPGDAWRRDSLRLAAQGDSARRQRLDARWAYVTALQLDEDGTDCVAFDPGRGECLLSVEAFNRRVVEAPPFPGAERFGSPREVPAADLRRKLLAAMLHGEYLRHRLSRDSARDSLDREWQTAVDRRSAEARRQIGDSALRALYARCRGDFQAREERIVQVLAMSDSILADSLWRAFSNPAGGRPGGGWSWRVPDPGDLPPQAQAAAAGLARGETSRPLRTPYGYLLVRWQSVRRRPALSFEEAIPLLLTHPRLTESDPARAAQAKEVRVAGYYRAHRNQILSPDTLRLRIRLDPEIHPRSRKASARNGNGTAGDSGPLPADSRRTRVAGFYDLPPSVQNALAGCLPARTGVRIGPIPSAFGTWDFEVLEHARGGRPLTLAEARPIILRWLNLAAEEPMEAAIRDTRAQDQDMWLSLAQTYLEGRSPRESPGEDAASGSAQPGLPRTLAADKLEWMRALLHVRFVDLGPDRK